MAIQKKLHFWKAKGKSVATSTYPKPLAIVKLKPASRYKIRSKSEAPQSNEASKRKKIVLQSVS